MGIAPTKATVKNAVEMSKNVIALEFDSEVLVNQAPVLKLANGNLVPFLTQYDTKTLLFAANKEDIGQEITEIVAGAIESMHNLPVNLEGAGVPGGTNGKEIAINEVPEFKGGVNGPGAIQPELPEFPLDKLPKVEQPRVEKPKLEQPKVEQPRVEQPKLEQPKLEQPKTRTT